ncbi:acyltransferase family protein [Flavobacterium taihuense]|uniref:Acyltransferase n=1 Tax=Flavobacterium taihuense TaxID=2857508 RepID=A0ABS6XYK7_9FLAO|nr:acyltransferase [Flavobacterium taihuense]MBW4361752.1 acyltransferase [Flavobacterium taihuense]
MQTNYINSLTPMRGIAAIWVMFFHMDVIIFYREFGTLIPHETSGILAKGYLWVDFFFLLSGFIISHVYGETLTHHFGKWKIIKTYLWARFCRIYPLHFFTLLLLIPFALVFPVISAAVVDGSWKTFMAWSALPSHLLLLNSMNQHVYLSWNLVSWSIGAEWWTYFAACFIIPFVFNKSWFKNGILAVVAVIILSFMVYWKGNLDITFDYGWVRCVAEFSLGTVLYQMYMNGLWKSWLSKSILFLFAFAFIVLIFHFSWNDLFILPIFCLLLLTTAYNNGAIKIMLETSIFKYLGDISYSIYMMHGVWFMVFWYCLPYLRSNYGIETLTLGMKVIFVTMFMSLTLLSAHFTYHFIEIKSRKILKKRIKSKQRNLETTV